MNNLNKYQKKSIEMFIDILKNYDIDDTGNFFKVNDYKIDDEFNIIYIPLEDNNE